MRIPCRKQHGQVLVMMALSAVVLIGSVGLAIDSALGYLVKARLNAAVDAASLAAARAVTLGNNEAEQKAHAREAARQFFNINYPDRFLLSTPQLAPTQVSFDAGTVTIDVSAQASLPVSLMGVLGFRTLEVAASAQTIRKDLDMVLAMDTSGSLKPNQDAVRQAGQDFLDKFNPDVDRLGLLHFASNAVQDIAIRASSRGFDRTRASSLIGNYVFDGGTNTAEGLWQARDQLNTIGIVNRSSLRVIVLFSDGSPAAFSAHFFPTGSGNCRSAGAVATPTDKPDYRSSSALDGLYQAGKSNQKNGQCNTAGVTEFPDWYNAHDADAREFAVVTGAPRVVSKKADTALKQWTNVHRASRNLAESFASKARQEGIYIFTLGMGASLVKGEGPDLEKGEDLLRCLANAPDARPACRKPAEPQGLYCYAATETDLSPCFTRLASAILRISR